ncbi:MAG TPA: hypothetical protein VIN32_04605 [Candidatus Limnocylindria bacterium]
MTDVLGPELEKLLAGLDLDRWNSAVSEYLDRTDHPNELFNLLSGGWLRGVVVPARRTNLLQHTVGLVEEWDAAHYPKRRHKGTPYYFLGMGYILLGDIDSELGDQGPRSTLATWAPPSHPSQPGGGRRRNALMQSPFEPTLRV